MELNVSLNGMVFDWTLIITFHFCFEIIINFQQYVYLSKLGVLLKNTAKLFTYNPLIPCKFTNEAPIKIRSYGQLFHLSLVLSTVRAEIQFRGHALQCFIARDVTCRQLRNRAAWRRRCPFIFSFYFYYYSFTFHNSKCYYFVAFLFFLF